MMRCCFIPCANPAEFEITHHCGDPYCTTQTCETHLGSLMGHVVGGGGAPEADTWTVQVISTGAALKEPHDG